MRKNEGGTPSYGKEKHIAPDFKRRELVFDSLTKLKRTQVVEGGDAGSRGTRLYTWGAGYHGQLGSNTYRKKCQRVPSLLDFREAVLQVACGGFHNAVLTAGGKLYTWGDGRLGQLGNLATKYNMSNTPQLVEQLVVYKVNVVQVGCGQHHTACVSSHGGLYTWGNGKHGQLGHGTKLDERYPRQVEVDKGQPEGDKALRFYQVTCGDRHTATLTEDRKVVTFGSGQHGQLGHGESLDHTRPKVVEALAGETILEVDAGATNTAAVSESGVVYLWGFGESIHPKDMENIVWSPRVVKLKSPAKQVACGQTHVAILTVEGDVYCFGAATEMQIGHGATTNVRLPRLVLKGKRIFEIAAGRYHTMAVSDTGAMYSWGCGESGQLAHDSLDNEEFPRVCEPILPNVVGQISCGEHHSMCIASIEHAGVASDVKEWLEIEAEEIRIKKAMLKDFPTGLKSKQVAALVEARVQLVLKQKEEQARDQEHEQKHLADQMASIRRRGSLQQEIAISMLEDKAKKPLLLETAEGVFTAIPPSTNARVQIADKEDEFPSNPPNISFGGLLHAPPGSSHAHAASPTNHQQSVDHHRDMLARSASAAKLPAKKVRPSSGQTRAKRMMSHSESAPTFKNRPSSATDGRGRRTEALATGLPYQPLAPRVGFMEKTSGALGQVKRALTKSNLLKPPKHKAKLFPLKKEFNVLRRQLEVKEKKLAQLQNDLLYLQPTEEELQREEHCQARIKNLNMKLVTLNTRLVEAEENKKNYELYILRMKEEDVQLSKQIDHLRNLVTEYDRLLSKMSRMNKRVSGQKVDIDGEIHKFHLDIDGFAGFAGETIQKYRGIVHARQLARTEDQTHQSTTGKAKKKMIAAQQQLAEESQQEEAAEVGAELDGWQGKVEYYEKRYHKISAATGLMRPEDIVNKFFFNDEITADLEQEIATRKTTLAALRAAQAEAAGELTAKKAGYMPTKWKDVDQIHASYQQEAKRSTRDQRALERHLSIHAMVVEGLTNVSATLTEVVGPHPAPTFLETPPNQDPGQASQYWCSRLDQEISNFLEHSVIMNRKHEARLAVEQREEAKLSTLNKERQLSTHTKAALSGFQGTSQTGSLPVTEGTDHGDYSDEYDD